MNPIHLLIALLALAALVPLALHIIRRARLVGAANTYDAAVETHERSVSRTNDVAVTTRHLLWASSGSTSVQLATASLAALGTIDNTESSTGVRQTVNLLGRGDTKKMVASGAITVGTHPAVYQDAGGKVSASGSIYVGVPMTSCTTDGDLIEVDDTVPRAQALALTVAATRTLTAAECSGLALVFFGHATEFAITLPAPFAGARFKAICTAAPASASYTIVTAASANIIHGVGLSSADAGGSASSTAGTPADRITFVDGQAKVGDYVEGVSDGTYWYVTAVMSDEDSIVFDVLS